VTRTARSSKEQRKRTDNKEISLDNPSGGRSKSTVGHTLSAGTTQQKGGGDYLSFPEVLHDKAAPSLRRGLGEGVADTVGGEDPHRGLQRPQLEAEDKVVADAEMVCNNSEICNPLPIN
jgi:hypothetical protein